MDLTDALAFARNRRQGVLATIRANGRPQLSNIMFVPGDRGSLLISLTDDRAKTKNLRRDPRASLYVMGDTFFQYVVIEAVAELSPVAADPRDETVEALIAVLPRRAGRAPRLGRVPGGHGFGPPAGADAAARTGLRPGGRGGVVGPGRSAARPSSAGGLGFGLGGLRAGSVAARRAE